MAFILILVSVMKTALPVTFSSGDLSFYIMYYSVMFKWALKEKKNIT